MRSVKTQLRRVTSNVKFTFEELSTILAQIVECLNSRPLTLLPSDDEFIKVLTPGHFLVSKPLEVTPDPAIIYHSLVSLVSLAPLVCHFWQRWSTEYVSTLHHFAKWHQPSRNIQVGDVLQLENTFPTKWPLARVIEVHPGKWLLSRLLQEHTRDSSSPS